jgi:nucleoside-diphosphate-sugar epimerase
VSEPTDVWREVARAIGEVGGGAVMSLAARLRDNPREPVSAEKRERVAWALAHIAARGAEATVESLAAGRDAVVAAAARRAVELANTAALNDAEVKAGDAPRDQTVNRAFSRRFFEAMRGTGVRPISRAAAGFDDDGEVLDDSEIIEDDEELLDEDDLIPG